MVCFDDFIIHSVCFTCYNYQWDYVSVGKFVSYLKLNNDFCLSLHMIVVDDDRL